ncbi:hypothetical protein BDR06DRAFT_977077 [Suillus hirtellus]|nr:hypothetical protein BDR06DRAFT_977077 [Suillus hirtellus]
MLSYLAHPPPLQVGAKDSVLYTVNISVPGLLLTLPIFDAIDTAASSSATPSDDGVDTANSELNDGDINFTDFLCFLKGYSAETHELDEMSGPPGWYSLEDLLNAGTSLMQGMMDGHLSGDGGELEGTGVTLEINGRDMNSCVTAVLSSKDTNVHGDVAPPVQYQNNTAEGIQLQTEGKQLKKKQRRSVLYIANDHNRTKAHSERASRLVCMVEDLDKASRPFIFLYIARQLSMRREITIMNIHETAMAYVHKQVLSSKDIIAINAEVYQVQAEKHQVMNELQNIQEAHSHELLAKQQHHQAVEAQLVSLTQQLELSAYNI